MARWERVQWRVEGEQDGWVGCIHVEGWKVPQYKYILLSIKDVILVHM